LHENGGVVGYSVERVGCGAGDGERILKELRAWRGRLWELRADALQALWAEAVAYARNEIGRYGCWWELEEPVLPDGYDAEGIAQQAFEKLLERERGAEPRVYSGEMIRQELQRLIKHRVRWLRQRSETRLVTGEWDVLPPGADGEPVSVFRGIPGQIAAPDVELLRKEKELLLEGFKGEFETCLGKREDLREVFRRVWEGSKRRQIAQELGLTVERVTNLQKQVDRRLAQFADGEWERRWRDIA